MGHLLIIPIPPILPIMQNRSIARIQEYIARNQTCDPERIRCGLKRHAEGPVPLPLIRAVLEGTALPSENPTDTPAPLPSGSTKTYSLSSVRVATVRPREGLKPKLFRLKRNTGYPLEELAEEWGVSAETLRRDAKRLDAILYVETSPGEWQQCVVHPDTSAERKA
jgi:hypothetical protein